MSKTCARQAIQADLDWGAVQEFLAQVQNLPGVNTNSYVSDDADSRGGFAYTGAGAANTNAEGKVTLRSYGSMTYAGLLALIYAQVDETDVRVQAAKDWAERHWSLDNPGMGQEGLYYFFNVLTKEPEGRRRCHPHAPRQPHRGLARRSRAQTGGPAKA